MSLSSPIVCAVNATTPFSAKGVSRFIAVTAGTITITSAEGVDLLSAYPVTAGSWHELNMFVSTTGGKITTAGGASGTATVC